MTLRRRNLIRRQPDQWASDHERARSLAALRLSEPLEGGDDAWLQGHLQGCEPCRVVAAEYASEQAQLKALPMAEPPRDLWARTQAALEAERRRSAPASGRSGIPGRLVLVPVMASLAVAFSVLSVTFLSSQPGPGATGAPPASDAPLPSVLVAATPIAVAAADVSWVQRARNGAYELIVAPVTEVCDVDARPDCPELSEPVERTIELPEAPQAVLKSPTDPALVVVETRSATGIGGVYAVAAETPRPTTEPTPLPTPLPTQEPTLEPTPGPSLEPTPAGSGEPIATPISSPPGPTIEPEPSATSLPGLVAIATDVVVTGAAPAFSADGAWLAFSARPADGGWGSDVFVWRPGDASARQITSDHQSVFSSWADTLVVISRVQPLGIDPLNPPEPTPDLSTPDPAIPSEAPSPAPTPTPTLSPAPTMPGNAFIGEIVVTVSDNLRVRSEPRVADDSIKYEPLLPLGTELRVLDGPVLGSGYVWYQVQPVDFAELEPPGYGWVAMGGKDGEPWIALAEPAAEPIVALPTTVLVEPATGQEASLPANAVWRPVLDPQGRVAVYWRGTLEFDPRLREWRPGEGRLMVGTWQEVQALAPAVTPSPDLGAVTPSPDLGAVSTPSPEPSVGETPQPPASLEPSSAPTTAPTVAPQLVSTDLIALSAGSLGDWDVAWSDGGSRFALWIGDPLTPGFGMLSLYAVDSSSGVPLVALPLIDRVPALHGFSLSDDRLAWAAPPGQDGEGSRLLVFAWRGEASGQVQSQPLSEDSPILVVR